MRAPPSGSHHALNGVCSASQRGGPITLSSRNSFARTLAAAEARIDAVIGSKLESFFELAEYNWMPTKPIPAGGEPSTYVFEMITFLTAYVDSVLNGLSTAIKTRAYSSALARINKWLMVSSAKPAYVVAGLTIRTR